MTKVHRSAARPSSGIEVEGLALLEAVEDQVELAARVSIDGSLYAPMREDDASSDQVMRFPSGESLEACDELSVEGLGAELLDELVVVDRDLLAIDDGSSDIPRRHELLDGCSPGRS